LIVLKTIFDNPYFYIEKHPLYGWPGYLLVYSKARKESMSEFSNEEQLALGVILSEVTRAVEKHTHAERVYSIMFAEGTPVVHFHIFPRTKELSENMREEKPNSPGAGWPAVSWVKEKYKVPNVKAECNVIFEKIRQDLSACPLLIPSGPLASESL
jgi:diadenosine tetraphosphate (Ap4A) HIT family hydrolase